MRILALGDVVGARSIDYLAERLWQFRRRESVDFVVANGENTSDIRGLCVSDARALLDTGIDLLTMGNHTYGQRDLYPFLDSDPRIIRPANYPPTAPGVGYTVVRVDGIRLLCINVSGLVYLDPLACPFDTVDRILEREYGSYDLALMDIHAEATSEKLALGLYFDGRVQLMFGTHTHVATADARILPGGSAYITDLGMCGPSDGILGTRAEPVIDRFRTHMPRHFHVSEGPIKATGILCDLDPDTKKAKSIKLIKL